MQTHFSDTQRADPAIRIADEQLRKCVHCGFCTATCPTYRLTGDERESPRGRITLIQNLLEDQTAPKSTTVANLDHCLSCLACESTCPSGVSYRRLIDQGRELIESRHRRPWLDRLNRWLLRRLLPNEKRFRFALNLAMLAKPVLTRFGDKLPAGTPLSAPLPDRVANRHETVQTGIYKAEGKEIMTVALVRGCVQNVLDPEIDAALIRVLRRHGATVIVPETAAGCCGALPHHLGHSSEARRMATENLLRWRPLLDSSSAVDAVVISASGCGSMLKDYPHVTGVSPHNSRLAEALSTRVMDSSELLMRLFANNPPQSRPELENIRIAWQSPCSLQHGMRIKQAPVEVLGQCGLSVREPENAYLCCGSAGTYNILQPQFANELGTDKVNKLKATGAEIIVSANIGCISQLRACSEPNMLPVLHLAQVVDWASGGPKPSNWP